MLSRIEKKQTTTGKAAGEIFTQAPGEQKWRVKELRPLVSHGKCSNCGLPVGWSEIGGKWSLNNPESAEHWDLCKQAIKKGDKAEAKLFGHTTRASLSLTMMACRGNDGVSNGL